MLNLFLLSVSDKSVINILMVSQSQKLNFHEAGSQWSYFKKCVFVVWLLSPQRISGRIYRPLAQAEKNDVKSRLRIHAVLGLYQHLPQLFSSREVGCVLQRVKISEDQSRILLYLPRKQEN